MKTCSISISKNLPSINFRSPY